MNKNSILRSILLIFILVSYLSSCATVKNDLMTSKNDRNFLTASFSFSTNESFLNGKVSFLKQKEKITINFKSSRFYPKFSLVFKNKDAYQLLVNNSFRNKVEEIIQRNDNLIYTLYLVVDWYYRDCLSGNCKLLKIIEDSILVEKISDGQEDTDKLVATNPFYKLQIQINK
tara:strand:+ start:1253 stop:1768 length:516 start_codon:yes stop_codon:yes gene_type:complete